MNATNGLLALLLITLVMLSLAACDTKGGDKMDGVGSEPKNAEEATVMYRELTTQEDAILSKNAVLWGKVLMTADKDMTTQEDGKNYGNFLLSTTGSAEDQFATDELKLVQGEAEEVHGIENKLTMIEEKCPAAAQGSLDGSMSMPTDNDVTAPPDGGSMQRFPAFEGKDLDGDTVKSDELFFGNAVTIVNFWLTAYNPYVGELAELDALNKELTERGGGVVDINAFTLDDDEAAIFEVKDVLSKKGAIYRNVYFPSDDEAGGFTTNVLAYPTAYVVGRSGNIAGDPIVGAITDKAQAETL